MLNTLVMKEFKKDVSSELNNILSFWLKYSLDDVNGGFYGEITDDLIVKTKSPKALILNTRILWSFSAAYRLTGKDKYLSVCKRAYHYLLDNFWDREYSGVLWMLDYQGNPVDRKKQIYGQAFAIYALTEFYRAVGEKKALNKALELFELIERYSYDEKYKGYIEACKRDWTLAEDMSLSEKEADLDEKKSMNTHLHILEAYTNLYRVWPDKKLNKKFKELIEIIIKHIIDDKTYHFKLFFDEKWNSLTETISYGHDIEGSWLLWEAVEVLGDEEIIKKTKEVAIQMAEVTYQEGLADDGSLLYEGDPSGIIDTDRHWWPQAEAVVGFLNAHQLTGEDKYMKAVLNCWKYIDLNIIDKEYGEWFWKIDADGKPIKEKSKVNPWKSPYHNSRACFEVLERLGDI